MNRKWIPFIVVGVLLILWLGVRYFQGTAGNERTTTNTTVNRDRGFDRRVSYLKYSQHARCRMQCRQITQSEVEEIMRAGKVNYRKSDLRNSRCPRYAVEGRTRDDQRVRIVYAQCNESTTVVTVIDLEQEFTCHCPGDQSALYIKHRKR